MRTLDALDTLLSLVSFVSLFALFTLGAGNALNALWTLKALFSGCSSVSFWPLRTGVAGVTLWPLFSRVTFGTLRSRCAGFSPGKHKVEHRVSARAGVGDGCRKSVLNAPDFDGCADAEHQISVNFCSKLVLFRKNRFQISH